MSSIESHFRRFQKIKASMPVPDTRPDLSLFTDEQLDEMHYQLMLEKAVSEGDTAEEAEKLRRRHEVTLDQLVDMFSSIDISQLPPAGDWIPIQEDDVTYSLSRAEYHHVSICIAIRGARAYRDDMWRWVEHFSSITMLV